MRADIGEPRVVARQFLEDRDYRFPCVLVMALTKPTSRSGSLGATGLPIESWPRLLLARL
jgi:hypothetical protein